jgi:hypothetical protein
MFKIIWQEKPFHSTTTINHCAMGSVSTINGIYRSLLLNNDVSNIRAFRIDQNLDPSVNTEYDLNTACVISVAEMKRREEKIAASA